MIEALGKMLVALGAGLALLGLAVWALGRAAGRGPGGLLPGDVLVRRGNFTFLFPVATCIAASAFLSVLAWLVNALRR